MYKISAFLLIIAALGACVSQQQSFLASPFNARCIGETDGRPFLAVEYNRFSDTVGGDIPVACEVITFGCEGDRVVRLSVEAQPGPARACTGNIAISDPSYLERIN